MNRSTVLELFLYNQWANGRILDSVERIDPDNWTQAGGMSHGSLRGILVHILAAEVLWRMRSLEGLSPTQLILESEFTRLSDLRMHWRDEDRQMQLHLDTMTDQDLQNVIHYQNTRQKHYENPLWQLLMHMINHGTQHRAEAAVVLTDFGASPGNLDMIAFWRENMA